MFKIEKKSKGSNVPRTIRFSENIFFKLKKIVDQESISFNELVVKCCEYALDHYDKSSTLKIAEEDEYD